MIVLIVFFAYSFCVFSYTQNTYYLAPKNMESSSVIIERIKKDILPFISKTNKIKDKLRALNELGKALNQLDQNQHQSLFNWVDDFGDPFFKMIDNRHHHTSDILKQLTLQESYQLIKIAINLEINSLKEIQNNKSGPIEEIFTRPTIFKIKKSVSITDIRDFMYGKKILAFKDPKKYFDPVNFDFEADPDIVFINNEIEIKAIVGKNTIENFPYEKRVLGRLVIDGENYDVVISDHYDEVIGNKLIGDEIDDNISAHQIEVYKENGWKRRDYLDLVAFSHFEFLSEKKVGENLIKSHMGPFWNHQAWIESAVIPEFLRNVLDHEESNPALLVDPALRNKGLGSLLIALRLAYGRDRLKASRASSVELSSFSIGIIENFGFIPKQANPSLDIRGEDETGSLVMWAQPESPGYLRGVVLPMNQAFSKIVF